MSPGVGIGMWIQETPIPPGPRAPWVGHTPNTPPQTASHAHFQHPSLASLEKVVNVGPLCLAALSLALRGSAVFSPPRALEEELPGVPGLEAPLPSSSSLSSAMADLMRRAGCLASSKARPRDAADDRPPPPVPPPSPPDCFLATPRKSSTDALASTAARQRRMPLKRACSRWIVRRGVFSRDTRFTREKEIVCQQRPNPCARQLPLCTLSHLGALRKAHP